MWGGYIGVHRHAIYGYDGQKENLVRYYLLGEYNGAHGVAYRAIIYSTIIPPPIRVEV